MSGKTAIYRHPYAKIAPLRLNSLMAVFDLKTAELFVGELTSRPNDLRKYDGSIPEGGIDVGETLAKTNERELVEEVGVTKPVFLLAAKSPMVCYFEDWATAEIYSGKLYTLSVYGIYGSNQINLSSGKDKQGDTFVSSQWLTVDGAGEWLAKHTWSDLRRNFIQETVDLLRPVERALMHLRQQNALSQITGYGVHQSLPHDAAKRYMPYLPKAFPLPPPDSPMLRLPIRNDPNQSAAPPAYIQ